MKKILLINDEQLVEGIVGALFAGLTTIIFKKLLSIRLFYSALLAWITTWFVRKVVLNYYIHSKEDKKTYGVLYI